MNESYHRPVLLQESIKGLSIDPTGIYVDATFGGGGHSREILRHLNQEGRLYAFDTDPEASKNVPDDTRFTLIQENFRYMKRFLRVHSVRKVDGVLADLGVSSHQFDEAIVILNNLGEPNKPFTLIEGDATDATYVTVDYLKELHAKHC
jgi:16S rRNA (cytosine1402-N4)-methyltransferase